MFTQHRLPSQNRSGRSQALEQRRVRGGGGGSCALQCSRSGSPWPPLSLAHAAWEAAPSSPARRSGSRAGWPAGSPLIRPRPTGSCRRGSGRRAARVCSQVGSEPLPGGGGGDPGSAVRGQGSSPEDRRCPRGSGQQTELYLERAFPRQCEAALGLRSRGIPGGALCPRGRGSAQPVSALAKAASCQEPFRCLSFVSGRIVRSRRSIREAAGGPPLAVLRSPGGRGTPGSPHLEPSNPGQAHRKVRKAAHKPGERTSALVLRPSCRYSPLLHTESGHLRFTTPGKRMSPVPSPPAGLSPALEFGLHWSLLDNERAL